MRTASSWMRWVMSRAAMETFAASSRRPLAWPTAALARPLREVAATAILFDVVGNSAGIAHELV